MTDSPRAASQPRKSSTIEPDVPEWRKSFLAHLAATSNVSESAKHAGISTTTAYDARRNDPEFFRDWQRSLLEGYEHLEMELLQRLRNGELKPAATAKRKPRAFDNGTAFRLLSLHRETVAHQRAIQEDVSEESVLASIDAKLERMRRTQRDLPEADGDAAQ